LEYSKDELVENAAFKRTLRGTIEFKIIPILCKLGLENVARGSRPRAAISRPAAK